MADRFWTKVDKNGPGGCWLWTSAKNSDGYGIIFVKGPKGAHRIAYELVVGPIPEGLQLDHLCRVRHCVNPSHLEPVTNRENGKRGLSPVNLQLLITLCPYGHPYDEANTYHRTGKKKGRECRACNKPTSDRRRGLPRPA